MLAKSSSIVGRLSKFSRHGYKENTSGHQHDYDTQLTSMPTSCFISTNSKKPRTIQVNQAKNYFVCVNVISFLAFSCNISNFGKLEGARYSAYLRQFVYTDTRTTTDRSTNLIISSNSHRSIGGDNNAHGTCTDTLYVTPVRLFFFSSRFN